LKVIKAIIIIFFYDIFMPHALVNVLQQGLREDS